MADTIRTLPTDQRITHHLSLAQGATKLGLILCNGRGDPDPTAMPQGKMPSRAMQFSQGDPDYSDMELPYTPITQKDWSGGRAQEDFEKDKTRYADSNAIDAMSGDVILGPKPNTSNVLASSTTYLSNTQNSQMGFLHPFTTRMSNQYHLHIDPAPHGSKSDNHIESQTVATRFQAPSNGSISQIKLWLAGTDSIRISIFKYNDLANLPGHDYCYAEWFVESIKGVPTGVGVSDHVTEDFNIVESAALQEYIFDFEYTFVSGSYYVLAAMSKKYYDPYFDGEITLGDEFPFQWGINNLAGSQLEYRHIQGYFWTLKWTGTYWYMYFYPDEANEPVQWSGYAGDFELPADSTYSLAFELGTYNDEPGETFFYKLRNTDFAVACPASGAAPKLYREGYHGYAADNTADQTIIHAKNVGQEAIGAIVKIVSGPGSTERIRWRKIVSVVTGASGYVIVDKAWNIVHTTSTEYAIYGTGTWTEITGHGLTTKLSDVLVVDDMVFFAQGEDVAIKRMTFYNSSQVWTPKYWTETAKATYIELIQDEKGVRKIWRALATAATVSSSDVAAWADAANILSFGTDITCGNKMYRITNIVAYGTPRIPFVLKEDGFGSINNGIYDQVPLAEFAAVADDNNGRSSLQRGVYLYLSMLNGLERYYEGRLDDIGPNRDQGLPNERSGYISHLLAYPGRMYAAIDHPTGYSSVLVYNDLGWHEIYRSSSGARIYSLHAQVIDGDKCDRLWVSLENGLIWLPVAIDPKKQSDYQYTPSGTVDNAWVSGNFKEIKKYFSSVIIYSEGLSSGQYVTVSYKLDSDSDTWKSLSTPITQSPSQEVMFSGHEVTGKKIKIRLTLYTSDPLKTPRIKAVTIKPVTRLPIKKSWTLTYKVDDNLFDLQGEKSTLSATALQAQLEAWSSSETTPAPLYMEHPHSMYNGKYVFIEPESVRPVEWVKDSNDQMVAIGQLSVFEAD